MTKYEDRPQHTPWAGLAIGAVLLLALLYAMLGPARAQEYDGDYTGNCLSADKSTAWTSKKASCLKAGGSFAPITTTSGVVTTTNMQTFHPLACDYGFQIVKDQFGQYMCAAQLKLPNVRILGP